MAAYRKPRSLKDMLVHSSLKEDSTQVRGCGLHRSIGTIKTLLSIALIGKNFVKMAEKQGFPGSEPPPPYPETHQPYPNAPYPPEANPSPTTTQPSPYPAQNPPPYNPNDPSVPVVNMPYQQTVGFPASQQQGHPAPPPQQGYPPPQQGYPPPQQGYPPPQQGYPPPQQGYPPPQQGYPAQQQGYPPAQQGYPAPQQGYQTTGGYPYTTQHNVTIVTGGPAVVVGGVPAPDYCGLSLFSCLFCCWPIGLVAVINAKHAREANQRGDYARASTYSQMARRYANIAITAGIILIICIVVFRIFAFN
ncbi:predicted protein [Nematostella vectensis]|uniref:Uncharacterized protein n=2 Tax=Nematostella vectensis TaxID=45351 RepID=A7SIX6_NEMVE|nr:predicted protein [Nematostella vectensis]|eukprot:XP_001628362.1 predicted protein [Nematostella vectensis]